MKETWLQLWINQERLGILKKISEGPLSFEYEPSWIEHDPNLPISRKLPIQEEAFKGELGENYFKNLLPDSETILNRIAAIHRLRNTNTFDLLAAIGIGAASE